MRRRKFISLLGGAAAWPFAVRAQQPHKVWRIGILGPSRDTRATAAQYQAFLVELKALGFNEGKNFTINYGRVDGQGLVTISFLRRIFSAICRARPLGDALSSMRAASPGAAATS
jgi:putative ABC transport system substrate-binding protein